LPPPHVTLNSGEATLYLLHNVLYNVDVGGDHSFNVGDVVRLMPLENGGCDGASDAAPAGYTELAGSACSGQNELGIFSGETVASCAARCNGASGCISFEHRPSDNKCQLSTSCNEQSGSFNGYSWLGSWNLYVASGTPVIDRVTFDSSFTMPIQLQGGHDGVEFKAYAMCLAGASSYDPNDPSTLTDSDFNWLDWVQFIVSYQPPSAPPPSPPPPPPPSPPPPSPSPPPPPPSPWLKKALVGLLVATIIRRGIRPHRESLTPPSPSPPWSHPSDACDTVCGEVTCGEVTQVFTCTELQNEHGCDCNGCCKEPI